MYEKIETALAAVLKESERLSSLYGKHYATSHDPDDRAKSVWYSAQHRLAENLHWHFTGGAEEDGVEPPSLWDAKEELPAIGYPEYSRRP